jgi:hypothetical protein
MAITVLLQDAEARAPDCERPELGIPATFEALPRQGDRVEGLSRGEEVWFTGEVDCVVHSLKRESGAYEPEVFIKLD